MGRRKKMDERQLKWDNRFMRLAQEITSWSKDPSTKVAAVVVSPDMTLISSGYNGPARGVRDDIPDRMERPLKYKVNVHAEVNSICNAARQGSSTMGGTLYVVGLPPCSLCASPMINAGIVRVVVPKMEVPERWQEDLDLANLLLQEAGVEVCIHDVDAGT
jgi:dCMP deaminase